MPLSPPVLLLPRYLHPPQHLRPLSMKDRERNDRKGDRDRRKINKYSFIIFNNDKTVSKKYGQKYKKTKIGCIVPLGCKAKHPTALEISLPARRPTENPGYTSRPLRGLKRRSSDEDEPQPKRRAAAHESDASPEPQKRKRGRSSDEQEEGQPAQKRVRTILIEPQPVKKSAEFQACILGTLGPAVASAGRGRRAQALLRAPPGAAPVPGARPRAPGERAQEIRPRQLWPRLPVMIKTCIKET